MSDGKVYDENYFLHGRESGKSLYDNYRWLPSLTTHMAQRIAEHCGIHGGARVLDFGCARGYMVKALRELGYQGFGIDVSKWALENCDTEVKQYLYSSFSGETYDWIIAKDVLEHIEYVQRTIDDLTRCARRAAQRDFHR